MGEAPLANAIKSFLMNLTSCSPAGHHRTSKIISGLPQNSENFFGLVHETDPAVRQSPSSFEGADDGTLFAI